MGARRRTWGKLIKLPSGNWRASYVGPDGTTHAAASTFSSKLDAEVWLGREKQLVDGGDWSPPAERFRHRASRQQTFGDFAATWLEGRLIKGQPLKPRTRDHYQRILDHLILPTFSDQALTSIKPEAVQAWYHSLGTRTPTYRAHAYSLLRTILASVDPSVLASNPASIRGAGSVARKHEIEPLTLEELEILTNAMPARRQLMVLLAAWCALRFGELTELRRRDVDLRQGVVKVHRAVVRTAQGVLVGTPKSDAGSRNVAIPPHLIPLVTAHLRDHVGSARDSLLFPGAAGGHLSPSSFYGRRPQSSNGHDARLQGGHGFYRARAIAGRRDLHFHDLRHTGAVLAAQTGATLAELMLRLGHSTPAAAMRYQHAAKGRDHAIAAAMSQLVRQPTTIG